MAYFPMFVQLKKKKCLVIGGGKIALRKIEVLKDFEADITVIAPEMITQMIKKQIMRSARSADERRFLSMRSIRKKIAALFFHPM